MVLCLSVCSVCAVKQQQCSSTVLTLKLETKSLREGVRFIDVCFVVSRTVIHAFCPGHLGVETSLPQKYFGPHLSRFVLLPPAKSCGWMFTQEGFFSPTPAHSQENVPFIKTTNLSPVYVRHGLFLVGLEQTRITFHILRT